MCDSGDTADCHLFEGVGMRREGEFLKDRFVGDRWASTAWYGLLNEEYQAKGQGDPGQASG
jgi:RimJ/RimL family protein N-acetyltransferase